MSKVSFDKEFDERLVRLALKCQYDPVAFVEAAYPWGEKGTALENFDGPLPWQRDALLYLADDLYKKENGIEGGPVRLARATGHGVGKSAFSVFGTQWFLTTRRNSNVAITANTERQLKNVTWKELAIWHERFLFKDWFEWKGTTYANVVSPASWYAFQATWSEANPEGFQGQHGRNFMIIMDEASGIPRPVWEAARGATTTAGNVQIALGNPTRAEGEFYDIFHKRAHRWNCAHIDSREVAQVKDSEGKLRKEQIADLDYLNEMIEDFGEDSDFCRVRIRGLFPQQSANQLISSQDIEDARERTVDAEIFTKYPVTMGVDPSHYGDDYTAVILRQGPKVLKVHKFQKTSVVETARLVEGIYRTTEPRPRAIFVDQTGGGQGVVDVLYDMGGLPVMGVAMSGRADEATRFYNTRAEIWWRMAEWVKKADLPDSGQELADQLRVQEFFYDRAKGRVQLVPKEQMRSRGIESPDQADALALTFFMPTFSSPDYDEDEIVYSEREFDGDEITGY